MGRLETQLPQFSKLHTDILVRGHKHTATWDFQIKTQKADGLNSLLVYWQAAGLKQWVIQRYGAGSPSHTDHCIPARLPQEKHNYKYTSNTIT